MVSPAEFSPPPCILCPYKWDLPDPSLESEENKNISPLIYDMELHVRYRTMGGGNLYLNSQCTGLHTNFRCFSHPISLILSCHIARCVKAFLQERHTNSMTWPTNSTDLNMTEHLWLRKLEPAWCRMLFILCKVHVSKKYRCHKSSRRSSKEIWDFFFFPSTLSLSPTHVCCRSMWCVLSASSCWHCPSARS